MDFNGFFHLCPQINGCSDGDGPNGDNARAFPSNFFPNLRIFFFFSSLPTAYCLLPTASSKPLPFRGLSLSQSGLSLSQLGLSLSQLGLSLSPKGLSLSQRGHSLSPQALLLSPGGELLLSFKRGLRREAGGRRFRIRFYPRKDTKKTRKGFRSPRLCVFAPWRLCMKPLWLPLLFRIAASSSSEPSVSLW